MPCRRAALFRRARRLRLSGSRGALLPVIRLAHAGDLDRAVEILAEVVNRDFYPYETFMRHPWLDPLRGRHDFDAILELAQHNHEKAHAAFVNAGGKTLLGVDG